MHYDHPDACALIKHGGFDWVVLQEGSDAQAGDARLFFEYATKFDAVHMGMHGGYAVPSAFYAVLAGGAAFPPPAVLVQQVAIAPDVAAVIQEQALAAVRDYCGCSASFML